MKLVVISGLSGSGKSIALEALEDFGFYCIDNLPIALLPAFASRMDGGVSNGVYDKAAVGIDARNHREDLRHFPAILRDIQQAGIECEVVFLVANDDTLLKRFSETRRRHPLTQQDISLAEAIKIEHELLAPISEHASLQIDTSHTNVHQLRDLIRERVARQHSLSLSLLFVSFGYKHGIPADADFVFDIRCLPNPNWVARLRPLTGIDQPVRRFLDQQPRFVQMYEELRTFFDHWIPCFESENRVYMTTAIGCTGGQHRSVYMVELMAEHFRGKRENVISRHRELS
ncbi:MAG TPA: RNase adapter RapZ [Gammaproteobacteria bacterium]|nr:RNase adapter RapZ [Gammaproteobacteria bacterium]